MQLWGKCRWVQVWRGVSVDRKSGRDTGVGVQVWEVEVWRGGCVDGRSVEGCRCGGAGVGSGSMEGCRCEVGVWRDAGGRSVEGCRYGGVSGEGCRYDRKWKCGGVVEVGVWR